MPVELCSCQAGFTKNDILASREQRAFAVQDQAGAWRRLAAEYLTSGDRDRASACKRVAHHHLFSAVHARVEAEPNVAVGYLQAAQACLPVQHLLAAE